MSIFGNLKDKIARYVDVQLRLLRLGLIERTSYLLSYIIFSMIVLFIVFCILLFTGFGLTELFVLAGLSKALSFFITIGIYALLLIIVLALRKKITRYFAGEVVNVMTENDSKQEDEE